jgi:DNA-directed RNA polymerase subunit RPC12/RpoP
MKPKNKLQKQVFELSQKLHPITDSQLKWAKSVCFERIARTTKQGTVSCLECGGSWKDKHITTKTIVCPHCNTILTVNQTRKTKFIKIEYLSVITTFQGFQVLRFLYVSQSLKVGEQAEYYCKEVVQRWISPNGVFATLALIRTMNFWKSSWMFDTDLEIRPEKHLYNVYPTAIYPRMNVLPIIKRNGFKGEFHDLTPFDIFHSLLINSKIETLLKTGQINLLQYFIFRASRNIDCYWDSIRIAIRNGYNIIDADVWCDYIDLLRHFGKDINSPKYVCSIRLTADHDQLVRRKQEQEKHIALEEKKRKAIEDDAKFQELKAKFFGLTFNDGELQLKVLDSVMEYVEEGTLMKHCVFSNDYHKKANSLILSATRNSERVATVEISLDTLKVVQCRGKSNSEVTEQKQIIRLITKNVNQIEKRIRA